MNGKSKRKLENDDSGKVLSHYVDNRIKLMQEVLSLISPKKIMTMAPDFMKNMQVSVVKSLLLEELLGISNKRLCSILAGENLNTDSSSSSESEIDKQKSDDTISLQEISDDSDCCIDIELSEKERLELEKDNAKLVPSDQIKTEHKRGKKIKNTGKLRRRKSNKKEWNDAEKPVVNVLNLLELQARARAIRSQLAKEILLDKDPNDTPTTSKITSDIKVEVATEPISDGDISSNSVICVSPDHLSVISVESNSDFENSKNDKESLNDGDKKITTSDKTENSENESVNSKIIDNCNDQDESEIEPWKTRWLESKKVQDIMKTTKLYNNLRHSRKHKCLQSEDGKSDSSILEKQCEESEETIKPVENEPNTNNDSNEIDESSNLPKDNVEEL